MPLTITHLRAPVPPRIQGKEPTGHRERTFRQTYKKWTKEDEEKLASLWYENSLGDIAKAFNNLHTKSAIGSKASRLGLKPKTPGKKKGMTHGA